MSRIVARTVADMTMFESVSYFDRYEISAASLARVVGAPLTMTTIEDAELSVYCIELFTHRGDAYRVQLISGTDNQWALFASRDGFYAMRAWGHQNGIKFRRATALAA